MLNHFTMAARATSFTISLEDSITGPGRTSSRLSSTVVGSADVDRLVQRIADPQFAHARADLVEERAFDRFLDEQARAGAAHLALVEPDRVDESLDGAVEIGVVEDHERRLAAELERQPLPRAGGRPANDAADLGRAGERELVDTRVGDDRGARLTVARHHIEHARRQPDRLAELG